jgi:uncharacterized membrane protein
VSPASDFTSGAALRFGWETFKKRPAFFIGATVVLLLALAVTGSITGGIDYAITGSAEKSSGVGSLINLGLGTLINMGATAFSLQAHDDPERVSLSSLWHPQPFWKFLGASLLVAIVVGIGMLLLIVPGIILGLMFLFTTYIVVDRERGPIEAMKDSKAITQGYKWQLLGFGILLALINLAGLMALAVGLLVTIPITLLAVAHAYRVLSRRVPGFGEARQPDASI